LVGGISQKTLTQTLGQMERDGLVVRTLHPVLPPKVEYRLTDMGLTLSEAFCGVWAWAEKNIERIETETPPTSCPDFWGDRLGAQPPYRVSDVVERQFVAREVSPGRPRRNGVSASTADWREANSTGMMKARLYIRLTSPARRQDLRDRP
jgi:hypothetical protein